MNDHSNSCLLIFLRDRLQNESLQELRNKDSKGAFQVSGTLYNASSKEFPGNQGNHQKGLIISPTAGGVLADF